MMNWDHPSPPTSSLASECAPPPEPGGGGTQSTGGEGLGKLQFRRRDWGKSLALSLLCALNFKGPVTGAQYSVCAH